ncbi:MAG: hypothetical protein ACRBBJ_14490 [Rhodomicrobiaceae bacterium]
MYARVTHYKMKPESVEIATAMLEQMKDPIMSLPGLKQFINSINADGTGCVYTIVESKEISDANQNAVASIWAQFSEHLEQAPEAQGFDVIANWSK